MASLREDDVLDEDDNHENHEIYVEIPRIVSRGYGNNHVPDLPSDLQQKIQLWETYPRIPQPEKLGIKLFPHQLVTVYKMEQLERLRKIKKTDHTFFMTDFGILGDIPGYGKSFSIVSLLLRDVMQWDHTVQNEKDDIYTYNSCLKFVNKTVKKRIRPNLIVCSSTLIEQWKEYFSFVTKGSLSIKEISAKKDLENFVLHINQWDVVICSSVRYNDMMDLIGNVVWKRFIFDEAGSTHIPNMRQIHAGFVWFVSATYMQLMRCSGTGNHYMKSFFSHIDYDVLPYFIIQNQIDFVKHSFKMPEVLHETHLCVNPRMLNVLSNYIDQESRLMISAGDIKGALLRLGGGSSTTDSNLFDVVAKKQRERLESAIFSVQFWKNRGVSGAKELETWEKRVKEIEKTISELEEKYKNVLKDDCTICYSEISDPVLLPCCQNVFCGGCIIKWLETTKTCPMCRAAVNLKEMVYIHMNGSKKNEEEKKDDSVEICKPKSKPQTVLDIVSVDKDTTGKKKKYLIFSMYDESFSTIRRELEEHKMEYVEISGSKATRDSKIRRFKEGKVDIVFLNSRFNGAGINLETATDIILYHEMPPSIEEQVIGRALRVGREGNVTIHHLCLS
jgi:SNF2 family DNA or RNA helicase